jgi:site-specific recombinase XerD
LQLRWKDLLENDNCKLTENKTGKHRTVTVNPALREIVQRIHDEVKPDINELLFVNRFGNKAISIQHVNTKLKEIFTHYNIKGQYSSHFMRKTLGRRVWSVNDYSEQALILLSQLFNHSSIQTTKIYLGIREQEISNLYLNI